MGRGQEGKRAIPPAIEVDPISPARRGNAGTARPLPSDTPTPTAYRRGRKEHTLSHLLATHLPLLHILRCSLQGNWSPRLLAAYPFPDSDQICTILPFPSSAQPSPSLHTASLQSVSQSVSPGVTRARQKQTAQHTENGPTAQQDGSLTAGAG